MAKEKRSTITCMAIMRAAEKHSAASRFAPFWNPFPMGENENV
jgi:hypothetical protein